MLALGYLPQMCEAQGGFHLACFSYVDDAVNPYEDAPSEVAEAARNDDCRNGLAVLELEMP
ncbi:MAG: hypothetical protein ACREFD_14995 [Stellaceae bacterium]